MPVLETTSENNGNCINNTDFSLVSLVEVEEKMQISGKYLK